MQNTQQSYLRQKCNICSIALNKIVITFSEQKVLMSTKQIRLEQNVNKGHIILIFNIFIMLREMAKHGSFIYLISTLFEK